MTQVLTHVLSALAGLLVLLITLLVPFAAVYMLYNFQDASSGIILFSYFEFEFR